MRDEYTIEMLFPVNLLKRLSLTPDVQVIMHPALNPDTDAVGVAAIALLKAVVAGVEALKTRKTAVEVAG